MIPLSTDTWGPEERSAILEVMLSGRYTMGAKTQAFEEAYAEYCGTKYCVAVNSGSSANLVMVAAYTLRHGPGKVIVPAVGWATSYSPFQQYGWELIFVDIDRETLNYDIAKLHRAYNLFSPDLILAVNLLGNSNEFDRFPVLPVLEDNCESMGAEYRGKMTGSFGQMGSHSTYFSHHICTMEGGMVTTDDEVYRDMLLSLRSHGWTRHLGKDNSLNAKVDKFHFIYPGYNVRPTDMQCAIGLEQLKKLPGLIEQRRENASRFPLRTQKEVGKSSWFGFAVFGDDRELVSEYESRPVVTGNFLRQPAIKYYDYQVCGDTKNADYVHDHALMIGNSHERMEWVLSKRAA
jgi:CDP-6-deoxy-D-xylo-4-hexulose-3-dehydrase